MPANVFQSQLISWLLTTAWQLYLLLSLTSEPCLLSTFTRLSAFFIISLALSSFTHSWPNFLAHLIFIFFTFWACASELWNFYCNRRLILYFFLPWLHLSANNRCIEHSESYSQRYKSLRIKYSEEMKTFSSIQFPFIMIEPHRLLLSFSCNLQKAKGNTEHITNK